MFAVSAVMLTKIIKSSDPTAAARISTKACDGCAPEEPAAPKQSLRRFLEAGNSAAANAIPDLGAAWPEFLNRAVIVEFRDMKPGRAPRRGAVLA